LNIAYSDEAIGPDTLSQLPDFGEAEVKLTPLLEEPEPRKQKAETVACSVKRKKADDSNEGAIVGTSNTTRPTKRQRLTIELGEIAITGFKRGSGTTKGKGNANFAQGDEGLANESAGTTTAKSRAAQRNRMRR
jgi:hypothetical protein